MESPRHDSFTHPSTPLLAWFKVEEGQDATSHRFLRRFGVDRHAFSGDWMHHWSQQAGVDD
jgi:hypothetical protein